MDDDADADAATLIFGTAASIPTATRLTLASAAIVTDIMVHEFRSMALIRAPILRPVAPAPAITSRPARHALPKFTGLATCHWRTCGSLLVVGTISVLLLVGRIFAAVLFPQEACMKLFELCMLINGSHARAGAQHVH